MECTIEFRQLAELRKEIHLYSGPLLVFLHINWVSDHITPYRLFIIIYLCIHHWTAFSHDMSNIKYNISGICFWEGITVEADSFGCSQFRQDRIVLQFHPVIARGGKFVLLIK
ncbi:hypothetical protein D3C81_1357550 [compost metagenome]